MSAFHVTSSDYLKAARVAAEENHQRGFLAIWQVCKISNREEAWTLFHDLMLAGSKTGYFCDNGHCVTALCLMASICADEEDDEEGQL